MSTLYVEQEPLIEVSKFGSVHLSFDGDNWIVFRTRAHFDEVLEQIDRQLMAGGSLASAEAAS